ncbi:hypothetical protein AA700_1745 [Acidiphilium acidophilum DSM 700]|nr:hypothetical protein AA700_1745 [Acidiphilium acidophilum DSM 700]
MSPLTFVNNYGWFAFTNKRCGKKEVAITPLGARVENSAFTSSVYFTLLF